MKLYCISGLGVDQRMFQNLELNQQEIVHINWIEPFKKESLEEYAVRLAEKIKDNEPFNLVGLSMGGMIATEISKFKHPEKLILLSSIEKRTEIPIRYRFLAFFGVHRYISLAFLKSSNVFSNYMFGVRTNDNKKLFKAALKDISPIFLRWSLKAILNWKNESKQNAIRIHGSKDKILPLKVDVDYLVKGGSHLMLLEKSDDISKILSKLLA